ncbi:hypothetical protein BJV82DRAFT_602723 [Fennellomyces sp. T-0311]|nr:hypothetical protein BJV82DRAFT_602723 [Fennellomyces sp. T-0311]
MPHHRYPFYISFWSPNASHIGIPDFSRGLNVLHQKLHQSVEENQVITEYLQQRAGVEHAYAEHLAALDRTEPGKAFDRDVGAGLKKCFEVVRTESSEAASTHQRRADNLNTTVLDPLERFTSRYERIVTQTKRIVDAKIMRFVEAAKVLEQTYATYLEKCRILQGLCPEYKHPNDPVWVQDWMFTRRQLCRFLEQLDGLTGEEIVRHVLKQSQQYQEEVCSRHSNVSGWSVTNDLGPRFDDPEKDSVTLCQALCEQGFLKSTADEFSQEAQYTVEFPAVGIPGTDYSEYLAERSKSFDSSASGMGSLFGRWGRSNNQISACHRAIHDMDQADKVYRDCVREVDQIRMETEEALFYHYEEMESLELERIQTIKQAFVSTAAILSNSIPFYKELYDRMMLYQETLKPDKDVEFIVEQYRTGRFCPRPLVYVNFFHGTAMDQIFGVPLDEYAQIHKVVVPPFISQGLAAIESSFPQIYKEERRKMWTSEIQLEHAHEARERLNVPSLSLVMVTQNIERYDAMVLASLIRLYLMELPECLLTFELYDPIKLLYTNQLLDDDTRLNSIIKLLTTMPSANFYTLKALVEHFHRLLIEPDNNETEREDILNDLAGSFCHVLLRPQIESTINSHDRHPYRLVRDLISNVDTMFSEDAVKAHEEFINRRAIVADPVSTATSSVKEPSLEVSSTSTASSISSAQVMTPTRDSMQSGEHREKMESNERRNSHETPPAPARRRTLLSFMRRSSSTSTADVARSATMSSLHRPIPVPSSSTLFEDPDETPSPRLGRASAEPPRRPRATDFPRRLSEEPSSKPSTRPIITTHFQSPPAQLTIEESPGPTPPPKDDEPIVDNTLKQARHSRASSLGTFQGSLDSFFKDEDL